MRHHNQLSSDYNNNNLQQCNQDSDCDDVVAKCCLLSTECPQHGSVCQKPHLNANNMHGLPSIPFNLTITERKKGKTVILSWDSVYNKQKPTLFVIEGKWSLKAPSSSNSNKDSDSSSMTQWGYLASTTNTNSVILRSINRGRWYKFRVASITRQGSFGFSQPTELFILSSPPKPPTQPQNLTINKIHSSQNSKVNIDLSWLGPKRSDLPIIEYKIKYSIISNASQLNEQNDESEISDDYESDAQQATTFNQDEYDTAMNYEIIDATKHIDNKYTLKNLDANLVYKIEIQAISMYESTKLYSSPKQVKCDTNIFNQEPVSSSLISDRQLLDDQPRTTSPKTSSKIDYEEEEEEEEDELDDDYDTQPIQTLPALTAQSSQQPQIISNLSVQVPYFQNGLVKAKVSWKSSSSFSSSNSGKGQASIKSIQTDQTQFTLTWFPIKCFTTQQQQHSTRMPQPISITTQTNNYEIYELKYNCDYVINVKLTAANPKPVQSNSIANIEQQQIVSAQFRVPACSQINIIGRIKPLCYNEPSTQPSSTATTTTTTTKTTTQRRTTTTTTGVILPRVSKINYKLLEKMKNLYSIEFSWHLQNRHLEFSGYQISIVPKEIPGLNENDLSMNGAYFGSVGAIVSKDQHSFVVRQLMSSVRYVFQIQSIGVDGQSYGPMNTMEFVIDDSKKNSNNKQNSKKQQQQASKSEYSILFPSASLTTSSKSSYLLNNNNYFNNSAVLFELNKSCLLLIFSFILLLFRS